MHLGAAHRPLVILAALGGVACGSSRAPSTSSAPRAQVGASASVEPSAATSSSAAPAASALAGPGVPRKCDLAGEGGWVGGRPFWSVVARGKPGSLLFGDVDKTTRRVKATFVVRADVEGVKASPARPGLVAVRTEKTTRLFTADKELPALPDAGPLGFSDDGKLLGVRTETALAVYDVDSFTRRFSTPIADGPQTIDFVRDEYIVCGGQGWPPFSAVLDQKTGALLREDTGRALLSPAKKTLAIVKEDKDQMRLVKLGAGGKLTTVDVAVTGAAQVDQILFDGETYVDILGIGGHDAPMPIIARVSVDAGRVVQGKTSRDYDGPNLKDLRAKARSLLPADRAFQEVAAGGSPGFVGPTSSGFLAAGTTPADPAASPSVQGLFIANVQSRKTLQTIPLPAGFVLMALAATPDEHFVLACSVADAAFFVDVATGRTALKEGAFDCQSTVNELEQRMNGSLLWTPKGLIDLASDEADAAWPALLAPDLEACHQLAEQK